jgi:AhpD family alkylhydroperoxidase
MGRCGRRDGRAALDDQVVALRGVFFAEQCAKSSMAPSGLSKLEREMVAVVVSSANRCYYCLVAHGQAVRRLSGDPQLGEMLVANHRVAPLEPRQREEADGTAWFERHEDVDVALVDEAFRKVRYTPFDVAHVQIENALLFSKFFERVVDDLAAHLPPGADAECQAVIRA